MHEAFEVERSEVVVDQRQQRPGACDQGAAEPLRQRRVAVARHAVRRAGGDHGLHVRDVGQRVVGGEPVGEARFGEQVAHRQHPRGGGGVGQEQHRVSGQQRRQHREQHVAFGGSLAADAGEHAARVETQRVALAGGPGQHAGLRDRLGLLQQLAQLRGEGFARIVLPEGIVRDAFVQCARRREARVHVAVAPLLLQLGERVHHGAAIEGLGQLARGLVGERAIERWMRGNRAQQASEVQRSAGLGPGSRQAPAAEGLHADHGADHVAVDIDVADGELARHQVDAGLDAAVDAEGETVARGVDAPRQVLEVGGAVADQVHHRAEDLARQLLDRVDLEQVRREEAALVAIRRQLAGVQHARAAGEPLDVRLQAGARTVVDDRADVGRGVRGIADAQFAHRARQHLDQPVGDLVLHVEHAQRRAALPGAVEARGDHVVHHLFRQRGGVDDHRVLAAGLGDQHRARAAARRELCGDVARHLGGAGEHHAGDARIRQQARADRLAGAAQQLQHLARHARGMEEFGQAQRHQRGLLGRLGDHGVAGHQGRGQLAGENRDREVPRADAEDRAARRERVPVRAEQRLRLHGVVAAEVDGFAHLGERVGERLARFLHAEGRQFVPAHPPSGRRRGAGSRRAPRPVSRPSSRPPRARAPRPVRCRARRRARSGPAPRGDRRD